QAAPDLRGQAEALPGQPPRIRPARGSPESGDGRRGTGPPDPRGRRSEAGAPRLSRQLPARAPHGRHRRLSLPSGPDTSLVGNRSAPLARPSAVESNLYVRPDLMLLRRGAHQAANRADGLATASDDAPTVLRVKLNAIEMHAVTLAVLDGHFIGMGDETTDDIVEEFLNGEGGFHGIFDTKKGVPRAPPSIYRLGRYLSRKRHQAEAWRAFL